MAKRAVLAALATMLWAGMFHQAMAQDGAETAIILGGAGHAQAGGSSLGAAISRSFDSVGKALGRSSARAVPHRPVYRMPRQRAAHAVAAMRETGDPFKGTDAPIYRLGNGAAISATGGLTPPPGARCVRDCAVAR